MDPASRAGKAPTADDDGLIRLQAALTGGGPAPAGEVLDRLGLGELKKLLALVRQQYEPLFAERKVVCIVGPVNTGKSSLFNALVGSSGPRAAVSAVPGSTRHALVGDGEAFWVIDTPGANEARVGGEGPAGGSERHAEALSSAQAADFLIILFDAARGVAQDEVKIYAELARLGKPSLVALNKIDLVRRDEDAVLKAAAAALQLAPEDVLPISATRRINLDRLLLAVIKADPRLLAAVAQLAPGSRWLLAGNTILSACVAAGTANLMTAPIQIPFASFVPITAIQVAMVLKLARIFGFPLGPARAKEIVLALGSALLGRTLFYQLVNLVPVAGYVLGTAVAAGTTMAVGYSVAAWFAYGEKPSRQAVGQLGQRLTRALVESLRGSRDRRTLRQNIQAAAAAVLGRVMGNTTRPQPNPREPAGDSQTNQVP